VAVAAALGGKPEYEKMIVEMVDKWASPPQSTAAYLAGMADNSIAGASYSNTAFVPPKEGGKTFLGSSLPS
jgi:hypothetical protein